MQQRYEPGTTILGRYIIERLLGEGGMGAVYVARHAELARKRFAVKVLRPEVFGSDEVEQRFRREAEVLGALNHPGIVSITDYGMEGTMPVMVMELLQGETLRDHLTAQGPLPIAETVRIIREVAATLDYTHGFDPPVVHRDLKPENLFVVQPEGRTKVLDFGIAKVAGMSTAITQANTTMGTPQYMSPEQLRDASKVDGRTDQFALASITYECFTGQIAFPGEGIGAVVLAIFDGERPRVTDVRRDVPAGVDAVLARAWSVEADDRYFTAVAFAEALATAVADAVDPAAATLPPTRVVKPGSTRPASDTRATSEGVAVTRVDGGAGSALPHAELTIGPRRRRAWMLVIAAVVLAGVAVGGTVALTRTSRRVSPAPTTEPVRVPPEVTPQEPVLPPTHPGIPAEPVVSGTGRPTSSAAIGSAPARSPPPAPAPASGTAPSTPPNPFDVVRVGMEPHIRECTAGSSLGRTTVVRITWDVQGLPLRAQVDPALPVPVRQCIGEAITLYGRVPPLSGRQPVTRPLTFTLR